MYDRIFSAQWFFDRCVQGAALLPWWVTLLSIITVIGFVFFSFSGNISFLRRVGVLVIAPVLGLVSYLIFIYSAFMMGYLVFSCSAGPMWVSVQAGKEIYDAIELRRSLGQPLPNSLEEIKTLYPEDYDTMTSFGKVSYTYNPASSRYTLMVRPSKYIVAVFDSEIKWRYLLVSEFWGRGLLKEAPVYPPNEAGPWEMLPQ